MSSRILLVVASTFVLVFSRSTIAADNGPTPKKNGDPGSKSGKDAGGDASDKKDTYAVVQIGDDVKICKDSEVNALRDKVNEDYKASLKAYEEGKKAAAKAKKKFNDTKPVKPAIKTLASYLKTEEDANALRDKTVQKIAMQKKKDKEDRAKSK